MRSGNQTRNGSTSDGMVLVDEHHAVRRVLLVQLRTMGDVILCTPAIREMRRAFPAARIEFVTDGAGAAALAGNPHLDEVLVWRPERGPLLRLLRDLRWRRYDTVVDLHSTPRTALLVAATRAPVRIGIRGRGPRNWAYTHFVPKVRESIYVARQKVDVLRPLGIHVAEDADLSLVIAVGEAERAWADRMWQRLGLGVSPVVALSPVSRETHKQWGAERWAEVADAIAGTGARVLITHGPGEREQAAAVVEHMEHSPAWDYGATTIPQLAALYARCQAWVGNDGGAKHVAVAAGIPTLSVIRWQIAPIWMDLRPGSGHHYLEKAPPQGCDLGCAACAHLGCLSAIEPAEVIAAVQSVRGVSPAAGGGRTLPVLGSHVRSA
jgi:heptosyltransferase III